MSETDQPFDALAHVAHATAAQAQHRPAEPGPINPWPLIHRIVYRAQAIAQVSPLPQAAVIFQRQIQIIPRHAVGVGCTVLWTWTKSDLSRGVSFPALAELEARFAAALQHDLEPNPAIQCPYAPAGLNLDPEELIV